MKTAFSVALVLAFASQAVFAQAPATPAAPAAASASGAANASAPAPAAASEAAKAPAAASAPAAAPTPAAAAAAALLKPDVARGGQIASQVCAACHAADGNSTIAQNPKLAGQHAAYIVHQLLDFKANADRKNPIMLGFASALTPADMANVAAYFSRQKPKDGAARNPKTIEAGQKIYRAGIADKAVPACAGCHGPTGAGIPAQFPRLGGQWPDYTKEQLKAFRTNARKNDPAGVMRAIAARMSDTDIDAVADYIAGLKRAN